MPRLKGDAVGKRAAAACVNEVDLKEQTPFKRGTHVMSDMSCTGWGEDSSHVGRPTPDRGSVCI